MAEPGDYKINYEPLFGPLQLIDVGEAITRADHPWYNQTLIEVGGVLLDRPRTSPATRPGANNRLNWNSLRSPVRSRRAEQHLLSSSSW